MQLKLNSSFLISENDTSLHTQLWIDPVEEFVQYTHTRDPVDITFGVKELKVMELYGNIYFVLYRGSLSEMILTKLQPSIYILLFRHNHSVADLHTHAFAVQFH